MKSTVTIARCGALIMTVLAAGTVADAALARQAKPSAPEVRRPAKPAQAKPAATAAKAATKPAKPLPQANASPAPAERKTILLHRITTPDPMQSGAFCRLLGRNAADDAAAMMEVSAVTQASPDGQALELTGLQIEITDYGPTGQLPTITRCLVTATDAAGMANSLGSILSRSAEWKDQDVGYRGAAYQTPGGFGLQFSQDEGRHQKTVAVCGQGAGRFVFADIGQVLLLKERIERQMRSSGLL